MTTKPLSGLTRRAFVGGALATTAALALAGCGKKDDGAASSTGTAGSDATSNEPKTGGEFRYYLTNPVAIEPFGAEENQGVEVMYNTFDPLCAYDWDKGEVVGLVAESWDVNDAADEFTFHLREGVKFHNGDPVTSKDFKYAWERLCTADFKPAPSSLGYKLAQVAGADEMMSGQATELDVECPDDQTLVVHLKAPFADFPSAACERALAPVPAGCTDTEEDFKQFRVHPIGNGPFMVDEDGWVDGQYIRLVRFDDYWGDKPLIDSITYSIFKDMDTAWTEFEAGNLDFTMVPAGQFNACQEKYGAADNDGYTANPGAQTLTGDETSIYYLLVNNNDEVMSNRDVRIALSYAIDRQAICDTAMQGTYSPATNMVPYGVPGYEEGAWTYAPATRDIDKANEYFDKAGYPADADGKRDLKITLSCNSGAGHEDIMQMVQAALADCGVDSEIEGQEWAAYVDALQAGDYQVGRLGWTIQVPYADSVLQPIFYTGAGDNNSGYTNPEFDAAIDKARQTVDEQERIKAYQEANAIVAEDFPVLPMFYYRHTYIVSERVNNFYYDPSGYATLTKCWLS